MINSLFRTTASLMQGYLLGTAFKLLLVTIIAFGAIMAGFSFGFSSLGWSGTSDGLFALAGGLLGGITGYFLTPVLLPVVSILFLDEVAEKVERQEYPTLAKAAENPGIWEALPASLQFILVALLLNLLALPFYLIPVINVMIYYLLNGYLFGREYFEMVASRYHGQAEVRRLRKENSGQIWLCGICIALGYTVPIVNLFLPLFATIFMIHSYVRRHGEIGTRRITLQK